MWIHQERQRFMAALCGGLCLSICLVATSARAEAVTEEESAVADVPVRKKKVALLLPLQSEHLANAAYAVRMGCEAAVRRADGDVQFDLVATDGVAENDWMAYQQLTRDYEMVVGPLSRSSVSMIVQEGAVIRPTISFTPPDDMDSAREQAGTLLTVGLPIEGEAREIAFWVEEEYQDGTVLVLSSGLPWQERAATAFSAQLNMLGIPVTRLQVGFDEKGVSRQARQQLLRTIREKHVQSMFVALDVRQLMAIRGVMEQAPAVRIYGTSHLNPFIRTNKDSHASLHQLDGVRLVDIPWQLQDEHESVMQYPPLVWPVGMRPGTDLARLYALGIDACRIAIEIESGRPDFEMNGVTGWLMVNVNTGKGAVFQREYMRAIYEQGRVLPLGHK